MSFLDPLLLGIKRILIGGNPISLPPGTNPPTVANFVSGVGGTYNTSTGSLDLTVSAVAGGGQQTNTLSNGLNSNIATANLGTLRFSGPSAAFSIGGFSPPSGAPVGGTTLQVVNLTSQPMTIVNNDASSIYPIMTGSAGPVVLPPRKTAVAFFYDGTLNAWQLQSAGLTYPTFYDVRDFGAQGNAHYFNSSNGKWYQDVGLTVEATDDAQYFRAANTYVGGLGGGSIYIPPGNYYFKTPAGAHNEFVVPQANITWYGDGDISAIRIAPGLNTVAAGGYGAVFGFLVFSSTGISAVDNLVFKDFLVDCNSAHNQFPGSNFGGVSYPQNAVVFNASGNCLVIDNVSVINHNGAFVFSAGVYGRPDLLTNFRITGCRSYHLADDPNVGDISWYAVTGTNGVVSGNRIDWGGSANIAWSSSGGTPGAGIEIHGLQTVLAHNTVVGSADFINVGVDSYDASDLLIADNVGKQCAGGVAILSSNGFLGQRITIARNLITVREGTGVGNPEIGIAVASNAVNSLPFGVGIYDVRIHDNTLVCTGSAPHTGSAGILIQSVQTGGNSVTIAARQNSHSYSPFATPPGNMYSSGGFRYCCTVAGISASSAPSLPTTVGVTYADGTATFLCSGAMTSGTSLTTGGGIDIRNNRIRNFGTVGVELTEANSPSSGNLMQDVHVAGNLISDCGTYGVYIVGSTGDSGPGFVGLEVLDNTIVDDRGGGSTLVYGVYLSAWADNTSVVFGNRVTGESSGDYFLNTAVFPNSAPYYPTETFHTVIIDADNIQNATEVGVLTIENLKPATVGAPNQYPASLHYYGSYWNGSASSAVDGYVEMFANSSPQFALAFKIAGGAVAYPFSAAWNPIITQTSWSGAGNVVIDKSQANGTITELYGQSGTAFWQVKSGATNNVSIKASDTGGNGQVAFTSTTQLGFFGASTVAQQVGGAATAGGTYTSTEQGMINRMYTALRNLGFMN